MWFHTKSRHGPNRSQAMVNTSQCVSSDYDELPDPAAGRDFYTAPANHTSASPVTRLTVHSLIAFAPSDW